MVQFMMDPVGVVEAVFQKAKGCLSTLKLLVNTHLAPKQEKRVLLDMRTVEKSVA